MKPPNAWIIAAAIVRDGDKVLLLEEDRLGKRQLNTPGGRVKSNDTPADTAVREVKEETGLDIKITSLVAVVEGTWADGANYARFIFEAEKIGGEPKPEKDFSLHWMTADDIKHMTDGAPPIIEIEKDMLLDYFESKQTVTQYFYRYGDDGFKRVA